MEGNGIALQVRGIYDRLGRAEKAFFGGPPYTSEIERELANYSEYELNGLPERSRVVLGSCVYDRKGSVIGFQASTVLYGANPTKYEKDNLRLKGPLSYVQLKKIIVDPNHWGEGISDELLDVSLGLATDLDIGLVVDINAKNSRMISFMEKHQAVTLKNWKTPRSTRMIRMGIS